MQKNKLIQFTDENKKFILAGIIALAIVILDIGLVFKPQIKAVSGINTKLKKLRSDITRAREVVTILQKGLPGKAGKTDELLQKIIDDRDIPLLLEQISNMAKENKVKIIQIKSVKDERGKPVASTLVSKFFDLRVIISASGGFHELGRFINQVERSPVFMDLDNLSIKHRKEDYLRHKIDITLVAYFIGK